MIDRDATPKDIQESSAPSEEEKKVHKVKDNRYKKGYKEVPAVKPEDQNKNPKNVVEIN